MIRSRNPANAHSPVTAVSAAPENGMLRKNRRSTSGSARRGSQATNTASAAAAAAKHSRIRGPAHP